MTKHKTAIWDSGDHRSQKVVQGNPGERVKQNLCVWHCLKLRYTYLQTISLVGTIMINQYINVCLPLCSNTPSWKKLRWLDSQYSNHLKHSRYSRTPFLGRTIIHVINPYKSLVEKLAKAVVNALCTDQNCTCTSYWPKWYSTTPNVNLSCFDVNRRLPSGNLT